MLCSHYGLLCCGSTTCDTFICDIIHFWKTKKEEEASDGSIGIPNRSMLGTQRIICSVYLGFLKLKQLTKDVK